MQSFVACSYLCENNKADKAVYTHGKKRRSRMILYSAKLMSEIRVDLGEGGVDVGGGIRSDEERDVSSAGIVDLV